MPKTANTAVNKSFISSSIETVWDMVKRWGAQAGIEDEVVEGFCEFVEADIRGKPKAAPKPKPSPKGKGKAKAEPAASVEEEETEEDEVSEAGEKPVVWLLTGCAKTPKPTNGVVYPKSLAPKVVSVVGELGEEKKLGRKYDGVSFLAEDSDDVEKQLKTRFTVEVKKFADVKPEDFPWAEAKGKAKPSPKGAKAKPGPKGKGKAKVVEVSEEPEEETEEDPAPKTKGGKPKAAPKGAKGKGKGAKAKNVGPLFEENQWGNTMTDFNLVFADLELKDKKGTTQVCIGVQDTDAEELEDDAEPWETLHQLDEDNMKVVKKFEKKHGVKVTCVADVYEKLKDEEVKQRLSDSGLVEAEETEESEE